MRLIEDHLEKSLKKALGKRIPITKGPFVKTKYTGIRAEVFIHAAKLIDFDGMMPDGAKTTRRPVKGPATFKGTEEERPGRIEIIITCTTGNYKLLQDICGLVASSSLLALQTLPKIPLGNTHDNSTKLHFIDFTRHIHSAELMNVTEEDISFYKGDVTLYLTGFIHVYITKRGGFASKSTTGRKIRKYALPVKKSKTTVKRKKSAGKG